MKLPETAMPTPEANPPAASGDPLGNIPRYAVFRGRRLRVLQYLGDDRFELLDRGDERRRLHRSQFTFVRSK